MQKFISLFFLFTLLNIRAMTTTLLVKPTELMQVYAQRDKQLVLERMENIHQTFIKAKMAKRDVAPLQRLYNDIQKNDSCLVYYFMHDVIEKSCSYYSHIGVAGTVYADELAYSIGTLYPVYTKAKILAPQYYNIAFQQEINSFSLYFHRKTIIEELKESLENIIEVSHRIVGSSEAQRLKERQMALYNEITESNLSEMEFENLLRTALPYLYTQLHLFAEHKDTLAHVYSSQAKVVGSLADFYIYTRKDMSSSTSTITETTPKLSKNQRKKLADKLKREPKVH